MEPSQFRESAYREMGQESSPPGDFSIKIGVEEVRLDAVIVDKSGRQITDLVSKDFEIYQDGKRQLITDIRYIPAGGKGALPDPGTALAREDVRRTIVFIFDNVSMSSTQVERARMAIRKFVETQMLPGDLVAVMPTGGGNSAMQTFSSDRRELLAMAENVQSYLDARTVRTTPQLLAYSYCIRALRSMPGRKYVMLISAQTDSPPSRISGGYSREYVRSRVRLAGLDADGPLGEKNMMMYDDYLRDMNPAFRMYTQAVDRIAADSVRAGVVIHSLDVRGVEYLQSVDMHTVQTPLPAKTGGLLIKSNFFANGIGELNEELKGYYLLSYVPPSNTFRQGKDVFHRIRIKVNRPGSRVHTREGFYGTDKKVDLPELQDPLLAAMYAPFRHAELPVSMMSGYTVDLPDGYLIQAFLQLNAQALQVADENDGSHSISFEVVGATLDINGSIRDSGRMQRKIRVNDSEMSWIREHGIRCSLSIPSKNPGSYYVRVAVRDKASGKIGSAYQFIEIPDLEKGRLTLSSIFAVDPDPSGDAPMDLTKEILQKRPAKMSYRAGDTLDCIAFVYNAKGATPDLESQLVLFRNGDVVQRGEPEAVERHGLRDSRQIPLRRKLYLENGIQPGNYMLQLTVKDRQASKNDPAATQIMSFQVLAE